MSANQNEILNTGAMCRRTFLHLSSTALGGIYFLMAAGCGSGSHNKASLSSPPSSNVSSGGRVQMTINWPERANAAARSRYVPPYAASLFFELYRHDDPTYRFSLVANRPSDKPTTQRIGFDILLPVGTYILAGVGRTEADGQGGTVASAATMVEVTNGVTVNVPLVLQSTIKSIAVLGQPLNVYLNSSLNLSGEARDPDGKLVVVPTGGLQWQIVSGSDIVSISPEGKLTALAVGSAQIKLIEPGAGISSDVATVNVNSERNANLVWVNSGSDLGYLNVLDGDFTEVGTIRDKDSGYSYGMNDIAWSSSSSPQLYGVTNNTLYLIDSTTAKTTSMGNIKVAGDRLSDTITGLTFRTDGRLYAAGTYLYEVNPLTAEAKKVGTLPVASAGDIAFAPNDELFLAGTSGGIWKVSPDTAAGERVTKNDADTYEFYGIAFTGGKLYGFSTNYVGNYYAIIQIDTDTGKTQNIRLQPKTLSTVSGASNASRL